MSVLAIYGSLAQHSRSSAMLAHVSRALVAAGHAVHAVGLRDLPAEDLIGAHAHSPAARRLQARVEAARAVVIASPVYKASFSGGLKALLDLLPENALAGRVVLPIATGGSLRHLLALEYALKPVLSALGARIILGGVYATDQDLAVLDDGAVAMSRSIQERLELAVREFAVQLALLPSSADGDEPGLALPANAIALPQPTGTQFANPSAVVALAAGAGGS